MLSLQLSTSLQQAAQAGNLVQLCAPLRRRATLSPRETSTHLGSAVLYARHRSTRLINATKATAQVEKQTLSGQPASIATWLFVGAPDQELAHTIGRS